MSLVGDPAFWAGVGSALRKELSNTCGSVSQHMKRGAVTGFGVLWEC